MTRSIVNTRATFPASLAVLLVLFAGVRWQARAASDHPRIVFSRYFEPLADGSANAVAVDVAGNTYLAGQTSSTNLATPGAFQRTNASAQPYLGGVDAFVAKFDPAGQLVYATYLGGAGYDIAQALAVDSAGAVFVAGNSDSTNFPARHRIQRQPSVTGNGDIFVVKLNAAGSALEYSTVIAGEGYDAATGLALDSAGRVVVVGNTTSTNFPVANALQSVHGGIVQAGRDYDGFILKLGPSGTNLVFSTYLGGARGDTIAGVALDSTDNICLAGDTSSDNFPTRAAWQPTHASTNSRNSVFVTKLTPSGNALVFSTYLGGGAYQSCRDIAVDPAGNIYLAGQTDSTNFPVVNALQPAIGGPTDNGSGGSFFPPDGFVTKFAPDGSRLIYSTYLGREGYDAITGLAVDRAGNVFLCGSMWRYFFGSALPISYLPLAFVAQLNAAGSQLVYAVPFGESPNAAAMSVAVDAAGQAYVAGQSAFSTNEARLRGLPDFNSTGAGPFVTKIATSQPQPIAPLVNLLSPAAGFGGTASTSFTFYASAFDLDGTVECVAYYDGDQLLGVTDAPPYAFTWDSVPAGLHQLSAVALDNDGEVGQSAAVPVLVAARPINDDRANSLPLGEGTELVVTGSNFGATTDPGDPYSSYGRSSVWWHWTAPESGAFAFTTEGSDFAAMVDVYLDEPFVGLTRVGASIFDPTNSFSVATFLAEEGMTYQIVVRGYRETFGVNSSGIPARREPWGSIRLALRRAQPPANDQFEHRQHLVGSSVIAHGTLFGATGTGEDPLGNCFGSGPAIWWSWTPPRDGFYFIEAEPPGAAFLQLDVLAGDSLENLAVIESGCGYGGTNISFVILNASTRTNYVIAISDAIVANHVTLRIHFYPPPANDDFANATVVTGSSWTVTGANFGATAEPGERTHRRYDARSVWWRWTAPANAKVTATTLGSTFRTVLQVFTGGDPESATLVGEDGSYSGEAAVSFRASAGVTYRFAVDGDFPRVGNIRLTLRAAQGPPNDDFAGRMPLAGVDVSVPVNLLEATRQPGEPVHVTDGRHSAWWTWTAPSAGPYSIRVISSYYQSDPQHRLAVYTGGSLSQLTLVGQDSGATDRGLRVWAQAGATYQIAVDERDAVFPFPGITRSLRIHSVPWNDDFADAFPLTGLNVMATGFTTNATREFGEPNHGDRSLYPGIAAVSAASLPQSPRSPSINGDGSIWWTWIAPESGTFAVELESDPNETPVVAIYTGSVLTNLTRVAGNATSGTIYAFPVVFNARAGVRYHFATILRSFFDTTGRHVTLRLRYHPHSTNDLFANRTPLTGALVEVTANALGATNEPGEPNHADVMPQHSLWWTWTAPSNGAYTVSTESKPATVQLAVYTGTELARLTRVGANYYGGTNYNSRVTFRATAGAVFQIVLDPVQPLDAVTLRLRPASPPPNDLFANRRALEGIDVMFDATSVDASGEPGEPGFASFSPASVWWTWTAPVDGTFLISGSVSTPRTDPNAEGAVTVFTGGSLAQVAVITNAAWDYTGAIHRTPFRAHAGTTYQLRFSPRLGQALSGRVRLRLEPPPPNDHFANRLRLHGDIVTIAGDNFGATLEPNERTAPDFFVALSSVWWTWTAGTNGDVTIFARAGDFGNAIAVYTGDALDRLVPVVSDWMHGRHGQVRFTAVAGTEYQIVQYSSEGLGGDVGLTLVSPPTPANFRFTSSSELANGAYQLTFDGAPGRTNVIEASTDLIHWQPINTNLNVIGTVRFTDPAARSFPTRFYRVREK